MLKILATPEGKILAVKVLAVERDGKPMGAAPCDNGCASAGKAHRVAARSKAVKKREGMDLVIAKGRFIGID